MTTSESIGELAGALSKAQGEMGGAVKDAENPFFSRPGHAAKYADFASVRDACGPLAKHGLSFVQFPTTRYEGTPEIFEWTAKSGEKRTGIRVVCVVSIATRLMHASGQWIEDVTSAILASGDPQAIGSAISYLKRYSLQAMLGIPSEDDDGEAAQGRPSEKLTAQPAAVASARLSSQPTGYEAWLNGFVLSAQAGRPAFLKAWKDAPIANREYLNQTNPTRFASLQEIATKVTKELTLAGS